MSVGEKLEPALRAMNVILVIARALAHEGRADLLVTVLDHAEYLPLLILEPADNTAKFEAIVRELGDLDPRFLVALDRLAQS